MAAVEDTATMVSLRLATVDDVGFLLRLRNDPLTRATSRTSQDEISHEGYVAWLEAAWASTTRKVYVAELAGRPIGTVRTDESDGVTELSWAVAPEWRGRGIGKLVACAAATKVSGPVSARVRPENASSLRLAEVAGLTRTHEAEGFVHFFRAAK